MKSFAKRRVKKEGVSSFLISLFSHRFSHSIYIYACFEQKVAEFEKNQADFLGFHQNTKNQGFRGQDNACFIKKRAGQNKYSTDEFVCNHLKRKKLDKKILFFGICFSPFENLSPIIPQKKSLFQRFFSFFLIS